MKIRNDLISIKNGDKQYDFSNLILNEYLKRFAKSQLNKDTIRNRENRKKLEYCLLKFDTSLNLSENMELNNSDFDVCLLGGTSSIFQELSEKEINVKYTYDSKFNVYDYEKSSGNNYISDYYGKKVTAIGFSGHWIGTDNVCAVLDTSNYNIYLQVNQDLVIVRKDIISSDALFWSNDKRVNGPAHLCPSGGDSILKQDDYTFYNGVTEKIPAERTAGILYSIGFSNSISNIGKEFIIGKDINVVQNENEININNVKNYINYQKYKYAIFKYMIWQDIKTYEPSVGTLEQYKMIYTPTDTKLYYHQAIELKKHGLTNLKIKYERN